MDKTVSTCYAPTHNHLETHMQTMSITAELDRTGAPPEEHRPYVWVRQHDGTELFIDCKSDADAEQLAERMREIINHHSIIRADD